MGKLNGLDLFSGYGGLTIALNEWVDPAAYCEIEKYCQGILLSRMDNGEIPTAPICTDVKELTGAELPRIDIIYGGFPCQDLSVAGNGKGLEGERSGLFYEIIRLAKEIQPQFIFLENVPGIRRKALHTVGWELADIGYDCRWLPLSAREVGAPHKRERWFCLAYTKGKNDGINLARESERQIQQFGICDESTNMAHARGERLEGYGDAGKAVKAIYDQGFASVGSNGNLSGNVSYSHGERFGGEAITTKAKDDKGIRESDGRSEASPFERSWWSSKSELGGVFDGLKLWLDKNQQVVDRVAKRIALYERSENDKKILSLLRERIGQEVDSEKLSRESYQLQKTQILRQVLRVLKEDGVNKARIQLQSEKISQEDLRELWQCGEIDSASRGPKKRKQYVGEYTDLVQLLSQLLAHDSEEAWIKYCRENALYFGEFGIGKTTVVSDFRVDRIKALGNGVVPLQAKTAFKILMGL